MTRILLFLILATNVALASPSLEARQIQSDNCSALPGAPRATDCKILLSFKGISSGDWDNFAQNVKLSQFHFYVVVHPDTPDVHVEDVSSDYLTGQPGPGSSFVETVTLALKQPLRSATTYMVAVEGGGAVGRVTTVISPKVSLVAPSSATDTTLLEIQAPFGIKVAENQLLTVKRKRVKINNAGAPVDTPELIPARFRQITANGIQIQLDRKLPVGQTSNLSIDSGITDANGNPVTVSGNIDVPGLPTEDKAAWILSKLAWSTAVHQKPILTASGFIGPFHPPTRAIYLGSVRFDPNVTFDIGSNTSKSSNSVIAPAPFVYYDLCGISPTAKCLARLGVPKFLDVLGLYFGPRFETDRRFQRYNPMAEGRAEFYFKNFYKGLQMSKAAAGAASPQYRDTINISENGFMIFPYLQLDAGGHANEEVVKNTKTGAKENVPSHPILRTYFGLNGLFQFWHFKVLADEYMVDMFEDETIGFTTDKGVALRKLSGFHPHGKLSIDFFVDSAKHFALNVTYENGRSAPNFEYLNKNDVGFKILF
jgi:hypothetical protein